MSCITILVAYGTRPEAIKMAPVVRELKRRVDRFNVVVCATAQHRAMMDQVHEVFALEADIDLDLMRPDQTLNGLSARCFEGVDKVLGKTKPDWVLVQGDTTTAMVVALAAFHRGIPVGHVEAGLRTGDLRHPFPEEANRRIIDVFAEALFAPTLRAADALRREGVADERIHVTGNTGIDALLQVADTLPPEPVRDEVLITVHRRESFGEPIRQIFQAIRDTEPDHRGEIQITDAIRLLRKEQPVYGYLFEGTRHDCGDKLGFLKGSVSLALKRPDYEKEFRSFLKDLDL